MKSKDEYKKKFNKEYKFLFWIAGNSLRKQFAVGLCFYLIFPLLLALVVEIRWHTTSEVEAAIQWLLLGSSVIVIIFGLFLIMRARYYRHVFFIQLFFSCVIALQFLLIGIWFLLEINQESTQVYVVCGLMLGLLFSIHKVRNEPQRWFRARRQGKLEEYLDEKNWTFKVEIPNTIEFNLISSDEAGRRWDMFNRLQKLHYLMPAIGMMLSRTFTDYRQVFVSVFILTIGLIFSAHLHFPLYTQIRAWEKEKGEPLLLHESWWNESREDEK